VGAAKVFNDGLQLGELHFRERQQDMVFAGEVIEKRAFANVSGISDVFYGSVREAVLREEIERRPKQAFADLQGALLAAVRRNCGQGGLHVTYTHI
jgi:hypothetical protein